MFLHRKLSFNSLLLCETKNVVHDPLNLIKRKPTKFIGFYFVYTTIQRGFNRDLGCVQSFIKLQQNISRLYFVPGSFFFFFFFERGITIKMGNSRAYNHKMSFDVYRNPLITRDSHVCFHVAVNHSCRILNLSF